MKRWKVSYIVILSIFAITSYCTHSNKEQKQQKQQKPVITNVATTVYTAEPDQVLKDFSNKNIEIEALYTDGSSSLEMIKNKSDKIINGIVESQIQFSPLSVESTISVKKNIKGKEFEKIKVYQLGTIGDSEVLQLNKEYVLCLGNQGKPNENIYYIKGGIQGMFLIDSNNVEAYDNIMKKDIEKFNDKSAVFTSDSNSQYNSLIEFLGK